MRNTPLGAFRPTLAGWFSLSLGGAAPRGRAPRWAETGAHQPPIYYRTDRA